MVSDWTIKKKLKDPKGAVHSHKKGKTTEVEKAAYSTSLETMTFNIASPAWREVESDIILTEEEKKEKIEVLLDYIGAGASR